MRIFARIFLSFWFATVLAILASMSSVLFYGADIGSDFTRGLQTDHLQKCVTDSLKMSHSIDKGPLRTSMAACKIRFLVDSSGRDSLGRLIPEKWQAIARASMTDGSMQIALVPSATLVALRSGNGGDAKVAMFLLPANGRVTFSALIWRVGPFSAATAIICYLLTGYFVRPLKRLGAVVEQLGGGNLRARIDGSLHSRRDEFGKLARTFNRMADQIKSLVEGQKRFLAHVSHELGSPLTRVNIALAIARRKAPMTILPELDRIDHETKELNKLVQQLLLLARLQSGNELSRQITRFDIAGLIEEVSSNAAFEAKQMDRMVAIRRNEGFELTGYPDLLKSALDNVVRNALRFTAKGSVVEVDFFTKSDLNTGVITVRDKGPGVDASKTESIFEPFSRAETSGGHSGAGLGLAIAREAILAHSGIIFAKNLPEGGFLLVIEIPLGGTRKRTNIHSKS